MKSPSAALLLTDNRLLHAFYLMNFCESKPKTATHCFYVMSAHIVEATGLKCGAGYVITGNNKFCAYPPTLCRLISADLVPESAPQHSGGRSPSVPLLELLSSQTAGCPGNQSMLTGSMLWCGAGCTHPLIAGVITNHQAFWLPFPPASLVSSSWVVICRLWKENKSCTCPSRCEHGCCP